MSVSYEIKEHLHFEGREAGYVTGADVCANIMHGQLAVLASLVLIDEASIYRLQMTADGKEYHFKGKEITPGYKAILAALEEAENVDLEVEYGYDRRFGWSLYELVGPFPLMDALKDPEEDLDFDNVFYSTWNTCVDDGGCGSLFAYGTKDGKTYNGEIPFEEVQTVPSGEWIAQDSPIAASTKRGDNENLPAFIDACKRFAPFCREEDLSFTDYEKEDEKEFYLNNLTLRTDEETRHFIELVKGLRKLSESQFGLMAELVDCSHKDARLMVIEEGEGDEFIIKIAMV